MKTYVMMIAILTCSILSFGQSEFKVNKRSINKVNKVARYEPKMEYGEKLFLPMKYGKSVISDKSQLKKLKGSTILKVEVVCTDFPKGIDLTILNQKRINSLKMAIPELKNNNAVKIEIISQTECMSKITAEQLYHGLVVTYKPEPTTDNTKSELEKIDKILSGEPIKATDYTYKAMLTDSLPVISGEVIWTVTKDSEHVGWSDTSWTEVRGVPVDLAFEETSGVGTTTLNYMPDSTFFKIMKRHPKWDKMMIVADLTGSMYPYTAQILAWLQLKNTDKRVKEFVFFNDGDMTPDAMKVIGKTGGIYVGNYSRYPEVKELASKTMLAGGGGDCPENNIEAILKGIEKCKDCEDIVMVADNWAPIKDIVLLEKLNRPVKIVLCGVWGGINVDYLNLAKATGGSVHTMEKDLTELAKMNEGETIEIGGMYYVINKGKFVLSKKM